MPVRLLVTAALLVVAAPVDAQSPPGADSTWNAIVDEWRTVMKDEGIIGGSMALVVDGDLTDLQTQGMANLAEGRMVDRSTIYHWASITKTFTAIAIMQLRDRGLLSLDDPIVAYVPELRGVRNEFGLMDEVTIRQLMSHSAGFRAATFPFAGGEEWHPHEPTEWSQLVTMLPYTQIEFQPGSKFSYSNPGIVFLGRTIEQVTGDVYEAYIDKNIFRPLGMRRSYFDTTPWNLRDFRSNNYTIVDGRPEAAGIDFNTGITVSNGGLNAPLTDMARYLAYLMGSHIDGADFDAVLSRNSLQEMWRTVVPIGESPMGTASMGLSFFLYDHDGVQVVGHTGSQLAFRAYLYFDPVAKVGVLAATNTVGSDGNPPDGDALRVLVSARLVNDLFPLFRRQEN